MKRKLLLLFFLSAYVMQAGAQEDLYQTIVKMDSIFFTAYNNCDLTTQADMYADRLEFYHDKTGLSTSKRDILANTEKYICGKVQRELVKGSIEVSPIPGYGAVELGAHMFVNKLNPAERSKASKFVIIWKNDHGAWKITRVISLHEAAKNFSDGKSDKKDSAY